MALVRTESEPFQKKSIHSPLAIQLRHAPGSPRATRAAAAPPAMGNDFHCPNVMVGVDACIRFQQPAVSVREPIRQCQRCRVRLTLDDVEMQVECSRDTRDHRPIAFAQLGDELREAHVVRLVDSDESRDVAGSESCSSCCVGAYRHRGPVRPNCASHPNSGFGRTDRLRPRSTLTWGSSPESYCMGAISQASGGSRSRTIAA